MSRLNLINPVRTPARPGPGAVPEALLRKVNLTVRRRIDGLLAGDHRSSAFGDGTELAQVRPYVLGDDVRMIDWNVTARTGEPHVRVNVAERAVETWLLLDTSASMTFGTADRRKWDVAEGVALAVGHLAARRGNRLGFATFGDRQPDLVSASAGRSRAAAAARSAPAGAGARAGRARPRSATRSHEPARLIRRRSVAVIVSDFRGPRDWRSHLLRLAARHDVVAIEIRDPREQGLPNVGELWLVDPENGRQLAREHA